MTHRRNNHWDNVNNRIVQNANCVSDGTMFNSKLVFSFLIQDMEYLHKDIVVTQSLHSTCVSVFIPLFEQICHILRVQYNFDTLAPFCLTYNIHSVCLNFEDVLTSKC